ncbi:hypothetical protein NPIL_188401 [Nephila pilipes]|uniref:Uncharacterized protein n=1 Tax=Nephila pilipes TaxID=299642 RepID=A0A8X6PQK3_NEPPI|nr:hypothetical protein NPIL_188401 [Nephila pilipes]
MTSLTSCSLCLYRVVRHCVRWVTRAGGVLDGTARGRMQRTTGDLHSSWCRGGCCVMDRCVTLSFAIPSTPAPQPRVAVCNIWRRIWADGNRWLCWTVDVGRRAATLGVENCSLVADARRGGAGMA